MKRLSNLLAALVFASLVIFMSCGGGGSDPAPSKGETQAGKISSNWSVSSVRDPDGSTSGWDNFTLRISGTSEGSDGIWGGDYTVTNVPSGLEDVWNPSGGTWKFKSASNVGVLVRDDGVEISVTSSDDSSSLDLEFIISGAGRTSSVNGDWLFELE
ncbi:hypothetical protein [Ekhidna sp. To15]|uniref:hypothetical protein n=1 Tax=Ekhidna sp. To15 TaxID=3395267 RepID=UPI003F521529